MSLRYTAMKRLRTLRVEMRREGGQSCREGERKAEGKWRKRWEKTIIEQKGGDLEAREQASEGVGGESEDQSERRENATI